MAQYKIATTSGIVTLEAASHVLDSYGLKFYADQSILLAHFPTYIYMVKVDALKTETESAE